MSCEGCKQQPHESTELVVLWKRRELAYHRLQSSSYTPLWAICVSPSMQGAVYSVKEGFVGRGRDMKYDSVASLCTISCLLGAQAVRVQMDPFLVQTLERWGNEAAVNEMEP